MYIIAGKFKKKSLFTPQSEAVRPTTSQLRETLFNICQLSVEGARFLDLFAGSGAMGFEALSRGASYAAFVENNRQALVAIRKNIAELGVADDTALWGMDVFKALERLVAQNTQFDIIYVDPPYSKGLGARVLTFVEENKVLAAGGSLFIEDASLELPPLRNLTLCSQRRSGRAHLYEFRYATALES